MPESRRQHFCCRFQGLRTPIHPLRSALQKLHTLDPIRIIEGKA